MPRWPESCVYTQVQLLCEKGQPQGQSVAVLSYDENPHNQAVGGTGVDRSPVVPPGKIPSTLYCNDLGKTKVNIR